MTTEWVKVTAEEVRPGDEVRLESGQQLVVSRIEREFMGIPEMLAFIQDTKERWFKQPLPVSTAVETRQVS